jgi:hypothetical protein
MKEKAVRLAEVICNLVAAGTVLALLLHISVADGHPFLAPFFYATPLPLIAGFSLTGAIVALVIDKRPAALLLFLVAVASAFFWRQTFPPPRAAVSSEAAAGQTLRVVTWNNGRSRSIAESAAFVRALEPNVAAVTEVAGYSDREAEEWQAALGAKRLRAMRGAMLLASDHRLGSPQFFQFGTRSRINVSQLSLGGREINVVAVDLDATPWRWREPDFAALGNILETYQGRPTIILGDFNAPLDSVGFRHLTDRGFVHAFRAAGKGPTETWPWPLPVLALDHIFVSREFRVVSSRRVGTKLSDHYAVVAEVELP